MVYGIILFVGMEYLPYEHKTRLPHRICKVNIAICYFVTTYCVLRSTKLQLTNIINVE